VWLNIPQDILNVAHCPGAHSDSARAGHRHPTAVQIGAMCGRELEELFLLYVFMWACKRAQYSAFQSSTTASSSNLSYVVLIT